MNARWLHGHTQQPMFSQSCHRGRCRKVLAQVVGGQRNLTRQPACENSGGMCERTGKSSPTADLGHYCYRYLVRSLDHSLDIAASYKQQYFPIPAMTETFTSLRNSTRWRRGCSSLCTCLFIATHQLFGPKQIACAEGRGTRDALAMQVLTWIKA